MSNVSERLLPLPNGSRGIVLALYLDLETPVDHLKSLEKGLANGSITPQNDPRDPENVARWDRQHAAAVRTWFAEMDDEACVLVSSSIAPVLLNMLAGSLDHGVSTVGAADPLASAIDLLRRSPDALGVGLGVSQAIRPHVSAGS
ncbi:MAG TPA: hypothetical protein VI759_07365 [Dehalococcoidia bacterium]|nr:hypothetical protein [Dehalococcoidia bacterium]